MTNSADPDQLASSEANWSGSTLFAKIWHVVLSKRRVKLYLLFQISRIPFTSYCEISPNKKLLNRLCTIQHSSFSFSTISGLSTKLARNASRSGLFPSLSSLLWCFGPVLIWNLAIVLPLSACHCFFICMCLWPFTNWPERDKEINGGVHTKDCFAGQTAPSPQETINFYIKSACFWCYVFRPNK